jgi:hypothetical protein
MRVGTLLTTARSVLHTFRQLRLANAPGIPEVREDISQASVSLT